MGARQLLLEVADHRLHKGLVLWVVLGAALLSVLPAHRSSRFLVILAGFSHSQLQRIGSRGLPLILLQVL